jgi:hypothetical protein
MLDFPDGEMEDEMRLEETTQEHTKIYSGSGHQSVKSYVHFFCIAPVRAWNTELEKASVCVMPTEGLSELKARLARGSLCSNGGEKP